MKKLVFISIIILVSIIIFIGSSFLISPNTVEIVLEKKEEPKTFSLLFVGDIMLDRGVEYAVKTKGDGDFKFPFLKIADYLNEADLLFGNLEGPISDKGVKVGSIYSFRAEIEALEGLVHAGFDVLSLANNHMFDYQALALKDCMNRLKDVDISYVGAGFNKEEAFSPVIKTIKDTRISFLAYTNLGPENWKATDDYAGMAWISENDLEKIKQDIAEAKQQVDILIVSLHAGEEYMEEPNETQKLFARAFIDAGADLVIGHHPHVIQSHEIYNGKYIFYSLGNFIFDQDFSEETMKGQIVRVLVEDKTITDVTPLDITINSSFQPEVIVNIDKF